MLFRILYVKRGYRVNKINTYLIIIYNLKGIENEFRIKSYPDIIALFFNIYMFVLSTICGSNLYLKFIIKYIDDNRFFVSLFWIESGTVYAFHEFFLIYFDACLEFRLDHLIDIYITAINKTWYSNSIFKLKTYMRFSNIDQNLLFSIRLKYLTYLT